MNSNTNILGAIISSSHGEIEMARERGEREREETKKTEKAKPGKNA